MQIFQRIAKVSEDCPFGKEYFGTALANVQFFFVTSMLPRGRKWPNAEGRKLISNRVYEKNGVPDCVGLIDGTHLILSQRPTIDGETYFNRKKTYSFNVQLICDDERTNLWYQLGWPGSVYDSTLPHS
jgi:hypothetical protein